MPHADKDTVAVTVVVAVAAVWTGSTRYAEPAEDADFSDSDSDSGPDAFRALARTAARRDGLVLEGEERCARPGGVFFPWLPGENVNTDQDLGDRALWACASVATAICANTGVTTPTFFRERQETPHNLK